MSVISYMQGLGMGASLILPLGAQNVFVLTQGVKNQRPLLVALICALCDASLIALGVGGAGSLIASSPLLLKLATAWGVLFLAWYGWRALRGALDTRPRGADQTEARQGTLLRIVAATLAVTLLNPHVYLDTVLLLGSLSAQHTGDGRYWFGAGAMTASFCWFFSLSLGARQLAPLFRQTLSWRLLDGFTCAVMWGVAGSLIIGSL
ncbi:LysE/ArgO family amino acid transporter [Parachitinimonas caeni]|uniref:LysE/ArgO family amino acid transporter n=1 Tax=Parachitinimonas caeni TaxID=3031301 RepID=A0ABT7E2P2_9NEIS|nr:LysE/ArgO family amino acid transporter [Parachitinimonas caeni]MDK2126586.1 LysE/ArgO family amino acid transporter [Parachitinimonas caeni]